MVLKPAERDELLIELKTAMVGIPGTDERGMAGDIKEIKKHIAKQNGRIRKLEIVVACLLVGGGGFSILEWQDVIHVFGG